MNVKWIRGSFVVVSLNLKFNEDVKENKEDLGYGQYWVRN